LTDLDASSKKRTAESLVSASVSIGREARAEFTGGTIIDKKIRHTLHISIGNKTRPCHGASNASCHLGMIKDMRGGKIFVDRMVIMDGWIPAR